MLSAEIIYYTYCCNFFAIKLLLHVCTQILHMCMFDVHALGIVIYIVTLMYALKGDPKQFLAFVL